MKKLKGIVLVVILLLASIMMPFDVYADTISNSNVHINYYMKSQTVTSSGSYRQIYQIDYIFDKEYVGWISSKVVYTYYTDNNLTQSQAEFTRAIYVNGGTASITYAISTTANLSSGAMVSMVQSVQNSNVTTYSEIETLEDIYNILIDINNNIEIDVLQELQDISDKLDISNDYLNIISNLGYSQLPFESFPFVAKFLSDLEVYSDIYSFVDMPVIYRYSYPMFKISSSSEVTLFKSAVYKNVPYYIIFATLASYNATNIQRYFYENDNDIEITNVTRLITFNYNNPDNPTSTPVPTWGIYKYEFNYIGASSANYVNFKTNMNPCFIIPIYAGQKTTPRSLEFSLRWGLTNDLIDDIDIIASGTTQSNQSASDLESGNDQMADDMNDLATIENDYNEQFNNQLQQIDFTSPIQNNAGILPAANFVITIFNGLINNNPFSVLIIVVCILLIGKKVIGK